jgi:hypothetical protein
MLSDLELDRLAKEVKRVPLPALASRLGVDILELSAALRKKGILVEAQPQELQYIHNGLGHMPAREIRDRLGMSASQFAQICGKNLDRRIRKSRDDLEIDEVKASTRWLIEEKLELARDDFLPRTINNRLFANAGLNHCLGFAERAKVSDTLYRNFPAVAFLVCQAYPDQYRPFQFRHAKNNDYFKGNEGRRNILNAVRWIIERKLLIDPGHVTLIAANKYFLRTADLQFYGVGPHWYLQHFESKEQLLQAVLKLYGDSGQRSTGGSSTRLRKALAAAGRPVSVCEVYGCYYDDEYGLDVHHVIPRAVAKARRIAVHGPDNLVALCPNHHRRARLFDEAELDMRRPGEWREHLLEALSSEPSEAESSA